MADFDDICAQFNPYREISASIYAESCDSLSHNLKLLSNQDPEISVGPPMRSCVTKGWLDGFRICLAALKTLDAETVEATAKAETPDFLVALLDRGWPINNTLRNGTLPSLLW